MKISYLSEKGKDMFLSVNGKEYCVLPESPLETEDIQSGERIDIYTKDAEKISPLKAILLFFGKLFFVNIFNLILFNNPRPWTEDKSLFTVKGSFTVEEDTEIGFVPASVEGKTLRVRPPRLYVNGNTGELSFSLDKNAVNSRFMRYCFDLIIYWFYATAIITLCLLGGDVVRQAVWYVPVLLGLTVPVFVKLLYENKKRKKLLWLSQNGFSDAKCRKPQKNNKKFKNHS